MFKYFKARRAEKQAAFQLYQKLVEQARAVCFYTDYGVADTVEGRFDMILLHLYLVDARLQSDDDATGTTGLLGLRRHLQEAMVSDMDRSFREMGVGDMSVGKEMKKVGSAWLGRQGAYGKAFGAEVADIDALKAALSNNLYSSSPDVKVDTEAGATTVSKMVLYVIAAQKSLAQADVAAVEKTDFTFPDPASIAVVEKAPE